MKPIRTNTKPLIVAAALLCIFPLLSFAPGTIETRAVTIIVLTLDDRPPNNLFLKQLGAIAGINLDVCFGPMDSETCTSADLVSLNAAVAGSLVGSRTTDPWTLDPPIVKPDALLHFAVPRVEPTVAESDVADEYHNIRDLLNDYGIQNTVLGRIRGGLPELENQYLEAYANRMRGWLRFLNIGDYDPDRLLITLDDNRQGPLSEGLKYLFGVFSNYVYDGTDEGMMLLLARALRERQDPENLPSTCGITWSSSWDFLSVQPFESDTPLENLLAMSDWLGLELSSSYQNTEPWRPLVWIHSSDESATQYWDYSNEIIYFSRELNDRPVIVADVARPNGGDPHLFEVWQERAAPAGLVGYVAWNTSSNTLGSALALWVAIDFAYYHSSDPESVHAASEAFLMARLLDDYIYQRVIRSEFYSSVRSEGGDPYKLSEEETADLEESISSRINELWNEISEAIGIELRYVDPLNNTHFIVDLPWNRLFEIALYPTDDRGIIPLTRMVPPKDRTVP